MKDFTQVKLQEKRREILAPRAPRALLAPRALGVVFKILNILDATFFVLFLCLSGLLRFRPIGTFFLPLLLDFFKFLRSLGLRLSPNC